MFSFASNLLYTGFIDSLILQSFPVLKVSAFYRNMEWEVSGSQVYNDSWSLRKLFGYAHRRQADCVRREQTPKET